MEAKPADAHSARLARLATEIDSASAAMDAGDPEAPARLAHALTVDLRDAAAETLERVAETLEGFGYTPSAPPPAIDSEATAK